MRKSILIAVLVILGLALTFGNPGVTPLQWAEHYRIGDRPSAITQEEIPFIELIPGFGSTAIGNLRNNLPITTVDELEEAVGPGKKRDILLALYNLTRAEQPPEVETPERTGSQITIVTWNVRGYPEREQDRRDWFHGQIRRMNPDLICIQEIANDERVDEFLQEEGFTKVAFLDSSDGQDNAIFAADSLSILDMADPEGFQHPAQAAYVRSGGFDVIVVNVHLSWTDVELREREKQLLTKAVSELRRIDPDVLICGDFNTREPGMQELAEELEMVVMEPAGQEGVGTTYAGNRYDYFVISQDLADEEAMTSHIEIFEGDDLVYAEQVSDHRPVVAWFRIDGEFSDWK